MKKFLTFLFGFRTKYRKQEEAYHNESRRRGPVGHLIGLILTSAIPLLSLWGAFALPWSNSMWVLKIFCIACCFMIITVPSELLILGIVALRHRIRMRVQNKVEGSILDKTADMIAGEKRSEEDRKRVENYEARGTQNKMDLVIGILGIVMSILVVIAFVTMFILFSANVINGL